MTGKEAQEIIDELEDIYFKLVYFGNYREQYEKQVFYQLGHLVQRLEHVVALDKVSFNPTVDREDD